MKIEVEKLKKLPFNKQLVFAYLMCERFYPNYVYFSQNFSFGNIIVLRTAIDHIRKWLSQDILPVEIQQDFNDVELNTPDTDNFSSDHAAFALDTCCTILCTLKFLLDKHSDDLVCISRYGTDTADRYILSNIDLDVITLEFEEHILNDRIMQKEILIQNKIILFLISHSSFENSDIDNLLNEIII